MKTKFLFSLMLLIFVSAFAQPTTIYIGKTVTVGTTEVQYVINEASWVRSGNSAQTLLIITAEGNAGTIQFSVNRAVDDATDYDVPAGKAIYVTINNGLKNLRAKASVAGQEFVVYE